MQVIEHSWEVTPVVQAWQREVLRTGFVPTMGNLHEGHLRLIDVARQKSDRVVVSVSVTPLQFWKNEDLVAYPRTLQDDLNKLKARDVDLVFTPSDEAMYPNGPAESTLVHVPAYLSAQLEGAYRPNHFAGVATVVSKLFHIVRPDLAVFGEKDFQQLRVIEKMVSDLNLGVEVIGEPTVREADGLAMSSRNQYLSEAERKIAPQLYSTLRETRERILKQNVELADLEQAAIMQLEQQGLIPDYVAIRHSETLQESNSPTDPLVILAAVRLGNTRLIDNLRV